MENRQKEIDKLKDYKYGFSTDIENTRAPKGLNEDVIKFISNIKKEPQWMLDFRLKAFERFKVLKEPDWQKPKFPKIDYQDLYYYSQKKVTFIITERQNVSFFLKSKLDHFSQVCIKIENL